MESSARPRRDVACGVPRVVAMLAAVALASLPEKASAAVTLAPSRGELLYSQNADPDCSKLHPMKDPELPFNVARLTVEGVAPGTLATYRWSIAKKIDGLLAADLELGPGEEISAVSGMCAEFGNACVLTRDKLKFYNEPTILFVAPTCDVLPNNTQKAFKGGTTKIGVKVTSGHKKLGQSKVTLGWGRSGQIELFVEDFSGHFEDGLRKPGGVNIPAATTLAAQLLAQPVPEPAGGVQSYFFDGAAFNSADVPAEVRCPISRFDSCVELDVLGLGHAFPTVEARYADGSALCDKIEVRTSPCAARPELEIIAKPKAQTFDPDNPNRNTVDLTVRLVNASRSENGLPPCPFLLRGAGVLLCTEDIQVGGIKESKSTGFDLKHCSATTDQGCVSDFDCGPGACGRCQSGETCLTQNHCSKHFNKLCENDHDCDSTGSNPPCSVCDKNETCTRVLNFPGPDLGIDVGRSFDLIHETVKMRNELPDTAKITDTWTAHIFIPDATAEATKKYSIKGRPKPTPAP